jgi:hypothetical protein
VSQPAAGEPAEVTAAASAVRPPTCTGPAGRAASATVEQGTLRGEGEIGLAAGAIWNRWRVKKHFEVKVSDTSFRLSRKQEQIEQEAALDGIYVLRTSVPDTELEAPAVVRAYKQVKEVEPGFRELKGPLELRPIHHRLEERVRAHVFLCTLASSLSWHLHQAWAELILKDESPLTRADQVIKASRSTAAEHKAQTKRTTEGEPCHSLPTLLTELATRARNTIRLRTQARPSSSSQSPHPPRPGRSN